MRPDIFGRTGIPACPSPTLDDMKKLYYGLRSVRAVDVGLHDHQWGPRP
jgi:hypothetical protein